jgi:hypothetical protein
MRLETLEILGSHHPSQDSLDVFRRKAQVADHKLTVDAALMFETLRQLSPKFEPHVMLLGESSIHWRPNVTA